MISIVFLTIFLVYGIFKYRFRTRKKEDDDGAGENGDVQENS